ncbi:MAG TPA: DNA methyltransferase [Ktedonobacteraceae bacterium]|nr:DNA methyltransferase [Ktedonobacteraceae bacterium]
MMKDTHVRPSEGMQNFAYLEPYETFLDTKRVTAHATGIDVPLTALHQKLFPFQRDVVQWALRKGCAALFADCGLGKTYMQLSWADIIHHETGRDLLILAPLAVASQTVSEGIKLGIPVHICRTQSDVQPGINIANYEMLSHFDAGHFVGVVLDESSILKSYMGKTKRALVNAFSHTPYRLCCTATPAPNDVMEIGNHSEFLGVMLSNEMLARWFINDTMKSGHYRLKGHAEKDFWAWVASWAISLRKPSDLGYSDDGFTLPALQIRRLYIETDITVGVEQGQLFRAPEMNATNLHREMRLTAADRAQAVADLVNSSLEMWAVWCNTNYEADELVKRIPDAVEVRGSESIAEKERKITAFTNGQARVIIGKPQMLGFGLNWQHCHKTAFVGLSYSFEDFYQAVRRFYRFGQKQTVEVLIVAAETEAPLVAALERKMRAHMQMNAAMHASVSKLSPQDDLRLQRHQTFTYHQGEGYQLYHGDCVIVTRALPADSIHFSIFSPPFSSLYIYSDALEDMGNCANDAEFFRHFDFLIPELLRVTRPGRLCAVHCKDLVNYKGRDGAAGLRDFSGEIIRHFSSAGWQYHSKVTIWKDPVIEMQRTKAHGLLYKQLRTDSTFSRQGLPEYLLIFRKWPQNAEEETQIEPVTHTKEDFPLEVWQRFASPVWFDIRQTHVLNVEQARENQDEKHICPLQLDVIERALQLWTNPGDTLFDPFTGIGSTGYEALLLGRQFIGVELKQAYVQIAQKNLERVLRQKTQATLFEDVGAGEVSA